MEKGRNEGRTETVRHTEGRRRDFKRREGDYNLMLIS